MDVEQKRNNLGLSTDEVSLPHASTCTVKIQQEQINNQHAQIEKSSLALKATNKAGFPDGGWNLNNNLIGF